MYPDYYLSAISGSTCKQLASSFAEFLLTIVSPTAFRSDRFPMAWELMYNTWDYMDRGGFSSYFSGSVSKGTFRTIRSVKA